MGLVNCFNNNLSVLGATINKREKVSIVTVNEHFSFSFLFSFDWWTLFLCFFLRHHRHWCVFFFFLQTKKPNLSWTLFWVLLLDTFRFVSYQFSGLSILIYLRYKQGSLDYHNKEQKLPEQQSQLWTINEEKVENKKERKYNKRKKKKRKYS